MIFVRVAATRLQKHKYKWKSGTWPSFTRTKKEYYVNYANNTRTRIFSLWKTTIWISYCFVDVLECFDRDYIVDQFDLMTNVLFSNQLSYDLTIQSVNHNAKRVKLFVVFVSSNRIRLNTTVFVVIISRQSTRVDRFANVKQDVYCSSPSSALTNRRSSRVRRLRGRLYSSVCHRVVVAEFRRFLPLPSSVRTSRPHAYVRAKFRQAGGLMRSSTKCSSASIIRTAYRTECAYAHERNIFVVTFNIKYVQNKLSCTPLLPAGHANRTSYSYRVHIHVCISLHTCFIYGRRIVIVIIL